MTLSSGEKITCTDNHPFFVPGSGWVAAGQLCLGTQICPRAGPASTATFSRGVTVASVEFRSARPGATTTVYNFEVAYTHTYFVGNTDGGEWVHNDCNLANVVDELHGALWGPELQRTTGAIRAWNGNEFVTIAASSSYSPTAAQRAVAKGLGIEFARGNGHAEATAFNYALRRGWKVISVFASNKGCPACVAQSKAIGALYLSPIE